MNLGGQKKQPRRSKGQKKNQTKRNRWLALAHCAFRLWRKRQTISISTFHRVIYVTFLFFLLSLIYIVKRRGNKAALWIEGMLLVETTCPTLGSGSISPRHSTRRNVRSVFISGRELFESNLARTTAALSIPPPSANLAMP